MRDERIAKAIGRRIREWRKARGLTQTEFSDKLGGSYKKTNLSPIENGKKMPSVVGLRLMAKTMDTTMEALMDEGEEI